MQDKKEGLGIPARSFLFRSELSLGEVVLVEEVVLLEELVQALDALVLDDDDGGQGRSDDEGSLVEADEVLHGGNDVLHCISFRL